jgi:hypothetical protein
MRLLKISLLTATAFMAFVVPAKADYAVWTDVHTGTTVSYPDTWKPINNQQPNDFLTLSLPSGEDNAVCRIRADEDKRFMIYPNRLRGDVQQVEFSNNFWDQYTASYDQVNVLRQADGAGLGQGFASIALISYTTPPDEPYAVRAGIMEVANYFDKTYVAECSVAANSYSRWHQSFLSFFKTVTFKKSYHELKVGNHWNFLKDWGTIEVIFPNAVSRSVY